MQHTIFAVIYYNDIANTLWQITLSLMNSLIFTCLKLGAQLVYAVVKDALYHTLSYESFK